MHTFLYEGRKAERLDKTLSTFMEEHVSREKVKRLILDGMCQVDDTPCREPARKIVPGQKLSLTLPAEETSLQAEEGDVPILWQDPHLLIINKPAGLTVHPAPSCPHGTLIQRLLSVCPSLREHEGWRPGIVHRLDKDTSGLIMVAPDETARLKLAQAFAERTVQKTYLALVSGVPKQRSGECTAQMGRHPTNKTKMAVVAEGREAHTEWICLYADPAGAFSLLSVRLHTGRTHQIRVHMAHLGHPLLGDTTYAPRQIAALAPRQMLHAWKLAFTHPISGKNMDFVCPPPQDFRDCFAQLNNHVLRVVITGLPGCGKSLLTKLLGEEGIPTWSADDAVRTSYEPGGEGWQALHYRYRGAFTAKGEPVNKAAMSAAMFATPGMREEVESLIHPIANHDLHTFWQEADEQHRPLAVAEVPLWLESGGSKPKHGPNFGTVLLIGVNCPQETRHYRLRHLRQWPEDMIAAADSWQWPEQKKMAACDIVVRNQADEQALREESRKLVDRLHKIQQMQHASLDDLLLQ